MPSPASHVLQSVGGSVRLFLHRASFFWRGATVVAGAVFVALLIVAFTVPKVYESEAVIAYTKAADGSAAPQDDAALEERLHAALLDPRTLERVARGLASEQRDGNAAVPEAAVERVRQSIEVRPRGDQKFAISFRSGSAAYAQHGCQDLAQLTVQNLEAAAAASSPAAENAAKRAKALEERTRDLAAYVAAHPEVAMSQPNDAAKPPTRETVGAGHASSEAKGPAASADTALIVLQQERAKLEGRLAVAEKQKEASARSDNPYDPPAEEDPEALRQMIGQVKLAIAARQSAVTRAHRDEATPSGADKRPAAAPAASSSPADRAEWQRLVQALLEAQRDQPVKPSASPALSIVQAAILPSAPIKPNRPFLALVGLVSGLWMGVLWGFTRVALGHDVHPTRPQTARPPAPAAPVTAPAQPVVVATSVAEAARNATENAATPVIEAATPVIEAATPVEAFVEDNPTRRATTPSTPPTKESFWRPPLRMRVTQRGVVDLAAILAHTGKAAVSNMPAGVSASPIVDVGGASDVAPEAAMVPARPPSEPPPLAQAIPARPGSRRPGPLPNAQTLLGHAAPPSANFRRGEMPSSVPPARPRSDPPPRAPSDPPTQTRSDPPAQGRSDPPARPRSDPPARPRSDPPARPRSDPPARPRSDPPAQPGSERRPRSDPPRAAPDVPDGVIALRDVPSGWSPDPSIGGTDSVDELRAIREQLYRFAVRGCFVVGITSSPDAVEGKSRIAARLASALAEPGRARVLLMEGDFDGPAVHRLMRIEMPLASGFSEQVRRRMKGPKPAPWSIVRCSPCLQVLAEGRVRAPGLLSSVQFMDGISELRRYYDVIVLDGPTAGSVDSRVLDEISDGLVVVGANEAAMPEIRKKASQWFSKKSWMATLPATGDGKGT